ncbi:centrosomal protein of 126 kda [Plakobranchus ocellatus]|uniref:Centrosomal protein of 126 kDa n=1 Tax=Plakobranchus ocellatus TaxID=259542 RepID=A0AAV3YCR7_9GAST|nr:centrosomal protein of 126 kda [Plakobranchus ocellatus]
MDSRLIAGAYSQHYRALEQENHIENADKLDAIARAKKLSLETNKRRRTQAQKRKIEALREEKRRHEILSKRREEQKLATEKYQRSHIPPSARQHSGRRSPGRPGGGPVLEDALRLIRGSPRHYRPGSARDRVMSPRKENEDPFEKPYFEKHRHHVTRPGSGKNSHQIDSQIRAELMDHSLRNFTSSKTLFEQQLEQQQSLLLEQQQQSLREFNNAVQQEIDSDMTNYNGLVEEEKNYPNYDDSCSSVDSLEDSKESDYNKSGNWSQEIQKARDAVSIAEADYNISHTLEPKRNDDRQSQELDIKQRFPTQFYLHSRENNPNDQYPLNQDMTISVTYQPKTLSLPAENQAFPIAQKSNQYLTGAYNSDADNLHEELNETKTGDENDRHPYNQNQCHTAPLKQFSTDSLESGSSISTLSLNKNNHHSQNSQAVSKQAVTSSSSLAWVSPSSKINAASAIPTSSNTSNNNVTATEVYNPRYASAISLSIWPGQSGSTSNSSSSHVNSNSTSSQSATTPHFHTPTTSYSTTAPVCRNLSSANTYSSATVKRDAVLKSGIVGSSLTSANQARPQSLGSNTSGFDMNCQDLQYPLIQDYSKGFSGNQTGILFQQQQHQHHIDSLSANFQSQANVVHPSLVPTQALPVTQINGQAPQQLIQGQIQQQQQQQHQSYLFQQQIQQYQQQQQQKQFEVPRHYEQQHQQQQKKYDITPAPAESAVAVQSVPVPAVRTIFPIHRPPVPKSDTGTVSLPSSTSVSTAAGSQLSPGYAVVNEHLLAHETVIEQPSSATENVSEDGTQDGAPRIKGILKSGLSANPHLSSGKGTGHPRDSLELMRMQTEKKVKKKSVRFAEEPLNETTTDVKELAGTKNMVITNSGAPIYKPTMTRPASAKVVSTTQRMDIVAGKISRVASAGTVRQIANIPAQPMVARNSQVSSVPSDQVKGGVYVKDCQNEQSVLQSALPNNTKASTVINRPRAAAHIIMSSPEHNGVEEKQTMNRNSGSVTGGPTITDNTAATVHKSSLETKVKSINNNSLVSGKLPLKVPTAASTVTVYHVVREGAEDPKSDHHSQLQQQAYTEHNSNCKIISSLGSTVSQEQRQRLRDPSPASKRVPISNSMVTRTSIIPASTKISIPQPNMGVPSYSTSNASGGGNKGSGGAVFDENGMRIDRTPTDDEITWLWDKVRNCLNKEDPAGGGIANVRTQGNGGEKNGIDQGKQPPTLSTKLIDGASLGFGLSSSPGVNGVNGLRVGTGFFQPHPSPSAQNNKVRPALQQQGSYLRRYGLLKQRRATSATGPGSAPTQSPMSLQRASSAVNLRQPQQATIFSPPSQQGEQDIPQPLSQAYMPQDGVSESTAAFMMAERLAKQSLSDSHIQSAMQDAQGKQEAHNMRARLAVNRGGHSALSIEEQNLLASLDKLNERLRMADTPNTGTIHYHQPYQAHLPGFRGNETPFLENRRNSLLSPRSLGHAQQRSQSAKARQQTRQYR